MEKRDCRFLALWLKDKIKIKWQNKIKQFYDLIIFWILQTPLRSVCVLSFINVCVKWTQMLTNNKLTLQCEPVWVPEWHKQGEKNLFACCLLENEEFSSACEFFTTFSNHQGSNNWFMNHFFQTEIIKLIWNWLSLGFGVLVGQNDVWRRHIFFFIFRRFINQTNWQKAGRLIDNENKHYLVALSQLCDVWTCNDVFTNENNKLNEIWDEQLEIWCLTNTQWIGLRLTTLPRVPSPCCLHFLKEMWRLQFNHVWFTVYSRQPICLLHFVYSGQLLTIKLTFTE